MDNQNEFTGMVVRVTDLQDGDTVVFTNMQDLDVMTCGKIREHLRSKSGKDIGVIFLSEGAGVEVLRGAKP